MLKQFSFAILVYFCFALANVEAQCPYSATISGSNSICLFEITNLEINFSGGVPPYRIDLFTGANIFTINNYFPGQPISVSPFISTIYSLSEVTDALNCQADLFGEAAITVIDLPSAFPTEMSECDQGNGLAIFDLTTVEPIVNGATGFPVSWYIDQGLNNSIVNPNSYSSNTSIVYATIFDGVCHSGSVPVTLTVVGIPLAQPAELEACDNGDGIGVFDLTSYESLITGGTPNGVSWYEDVNASFPIPNPGVYLSMEQIIYAIVSDGSCSSLPIPITLSLDSGPTPIISGEFFFCENFATILFANDGFTDYQWSTGATTQNISVSAPGVYSVTVFNSNGWEGQANVVVEELSNPTPTISGPTQICDGETIILSADPGLVSYLWSNGSTAQSISVDFPGISEVTVIDAFGCAGSTSIEIEPTIPLTCSPSQPDTGSVTGNGIVQVSFSGGTPPYLLTWEGPAIDSLTVNSAGPLVIPNLVGGSYHLTLEDNAGCQSMCDFEILGNNTNTSCNEAEELILGLPNTCASLIEYFEFNNFNPNDGSAMPLFSGCQGDGQIDESTASNWYKIANVADSLNITITGLNSPNIILYEGTNCSDLIPIACASAFSGSGVVNLQVNKNNENDIYLQIAGGSPTDQDVFGLQIENIFRCITNDCIFNGILESNPAPVDNQFQAGQNVQFCYTVSNIRFNDNNWFHALELDFGHAWDLSTLEILSVSETCSDNGGTWDWYPTWNSCVDGEVFGPGFAFDVDYPGGCTGGGIGDPGDNFGDGFSGCAFSNYPYEFCWSIKVKDCIPSNSDDLNFNMRLLADGTSGGYVFPACILPINYYFLASGSESLVDLGPDLNLCQGETYTINASVPDCPGCSYQWNTNENTPAITVNAPATYSVTVTDPEGCTAEDNIQLTFLPPSNTFLTETICEGDSYFIGGQVFTQSGFYNLIFTSSIGCDSVVSLELTVLPEIYTALTAQICDDESYMIGNNSYDQPGQYFDILTSASGCDSIVELTLEVFPVYETFLSETVCAGQSFEFAGNIYTQSGTYQEALISTVGCDSLVSLDLLVLDVVSTLIDTTILQGESITIGDSTYDQEGVYYDTLFNASAFGCDSIIITELSILITECNSAGTIYFEAFTGQSNDVSPDTIFLCFGDTLKVRHNGDFDLSGDPNPITAPGIGYAYYDCPPDSTGPDLASILADPCLNHTSPIIIAGNPIEQSNNIWIATGQDPNGNLDIVNTGLTQEAFNSGNSLPTQLWLTPITIDDFNSVGFEFDGVGPIGPCVSVSTVEAFSVVWLNEIVISNLVLNSNGCGASFQITGGLAEWDGSNYSVSISKVDAPDITGDISSPPASHVGSISFTVPEAGTYQILVEDGKSCPTVATIEINMPEVELLTQNAITCFGDSDGIIELMVSVNGEVIEDLSEFEIIWSNGLSNVSVNAGLSAGQYSVTVTNPLGCTVNTEIQLDEPDLLESEVQVAICEGDSYTFGTDVYDIPGIYTVTLTSVNGCDSIVTLILDILPLPLVQITASNTHICTGESVILSATGGVAYLWNNGQTSAEIIVAPTTTSTYSVTVIDANGCEAEASITIEVSTQTEPLVITCTAIGTSELLFTWNAIDGVQTYQIQIENGPPQSISQTSYSITGLPPGEPATIHVTPLSTGPCNIDSAELTCTTLDCPDVTLDIIIPTGICANDSPIQLEVNQTGGTGSGTYQWQGVGIVETTGLFDPILAGPGNHLITVICLDGPCEYTTTSTLTVFPIPIAAFNLENDICLAGMGTITFQGEAGLDAIYNWDFDGGTAIPGNGQGPHEVSWSNSGLKTVSLVIEENGCLSQTFSPDVEVESPLPAPNISCISFNDQLAFGWSFVPGATGYDVNVLSGQTGEFGQYSPNIFIVSNLQANEAVTLEVIAINGGGVCSDSADTLSCSVDSDPILMLTDPVFELDEASSTIQLMPTGEFNGFDLKGPYPNPTRQEAKIEFGLENTQWLELEIIDINGRTLQSLFRSNLEKGIHHYNINTQLLTPGLYFLKIEVMNQVIIRKLVVI